MHLVNSSVKGPENKFVLKTKIIIKMYLKIFFTSNDKLFIERISSDSYSVGLPMSKLRTLEANALSRVRLLVIYGIASHL